jgi:hypothetical protein
MTQLHTTFRDVPSRLAWAAVERRFRYRLLAAGCAIVSGAALFLLSRVTDSAEPAADGVRVATRVSDVFTGQYHEAAATVPRPIWDGARRSGWHVVLAEFLLDAAPQLREQRPRGWPDGVTWDQVDAVHLPAQRVLVLAEKRRRDNGLVVESARVGGVLRHELGHIFDMLSAAETPGYHSSSATFQAAYADDVSRMEPALRDALQYYLQDRDAGRQETFAEAFGNVLGGGSDTAHREEFDRAFPRVLGHLRDAIDGYAERPTEPAAAAPRRWRILRRNRGY